MGPAKGSGLYADDAGTPAGVPSRQRTQQVIQVAEWRLALGGGG